MQVGSVGGGDLAFFTPLIPRLQTALDVHVSSLWSLSPPRLHATYSLVSASDVMILAQFFSFEVFPVSGCPTEGNIEVTRARV